MRHFKNMTRFGGILCNILLLGALGCGGAESTGDAPTGPEGTGSTSAALTSVANDDAPPSIGWICNAGVLGGGALFTVADCQLSKARNGALDTCARQTGENCVLKGCVLTHTIPDC